MSGLLTQTMGYASLGAVLPDLGFIASNPWNLTEGPSQHTAPTAQAQAVEAPATSACTSHAHAVQPNPTGQPPFYEQHPVMTGVGGTMAAALLVRNYWPVRPKPVQKVEKRTAEEGQVMAIMTEHAAALQALQDELYSADPQDIPQIYGQVQAQMREHIGIYEQMVSGFNDEMAHRSSEEVEDETSARESIVEMIAMRNMVLRAFQQAEAFINGLMENWHVRQIRDAHDFLREVEDRYFLLEDNWLKAIPMYGINFSNSMCTLIGTLVTLSILNMSLPYFFHDSFPDLVPLVPDPHAHMTLDAITNFFKQIGIFGLSFDAIYAGTKGMRCRNTKYRVARVWNKVLDTFGLPFEYMDPATTRVSRAIHSVAGWPWEVTTRYVYRARTLGALGMVRQVGRDLQFSFNDMATGALRVFSSDAPEIRPLGRLGDHTVGALVGGLFDWSVGLFENVMQNVIVGTKGSSISGKVRTAWQNPFALAWQNAAPSALCNLLHANATARVSQYRGNDDIDVVISRFLLGVAKGMFLTALISTAAINGHAEEATVIYLGAQAFIGGNSIFLSLLMTNATLRKRASDRWSHLTHRASGWWT